MRAFAIGNLSQQRCVLAAGVILRWRHVDGPNPTESAKEVEHVCFPLSSTLLLFPGMLKNKTYWLQLSIWNRLLAVCTAKRHPETSLDPPLEKSLDTKSRYRGTYLLCADKYCVATNIAFQSDFKGSLCVLWIRWKYWVSYRCFYKTESFWNWNLKRHCVDPAKKIQLDIGFRTRIGRAATTPFKNRSKNTEHCEP